MNTMADAFSKLDLSHLRHYDDSPEDEAPETIESDEIDAALDVGAPTRRMSLRELMWVTLKTRGPMKITALASYLGLPLKQVRGAVSQLCHFGGVTRNTPWKSKAPAMYSAVGDDYLSAVRAAYRRVPTCDVKPKREAPAPAPTLAPTPVTIVQTPSMLNAIPPELEDYTIAQLKGLRDVLNALFPGG